MSNDASSNISCLHFSVTTVYLFAHRKENQIFLIYKEIQSGAAANAYMTNNLLMYGEISVHFLIILGSPSSYMTLQLLHSEFPYI